MNLSIMNISDYQAYAAANKCTVEILQQTPVQFFILGISAFILAMIFHELGHWIALTLFKRKTCIMFGFDNDKLFCGTGMEYDYKCLSKEDKVVVYIAGILSGLIPIILFAWVFNPGLLIILAPYLLGCHKDLKLIWRNIGTWQNQ